MPEDQGKKNERPLSLSVIHLGQAEAKTGDSSGSQQNLEIPENVELIITEPFGFCSCDFPVIPFMTSQIFMSF